MMKRVFLVLAMAGLVGGCGVLSKGKKPVTPTVGQRISVLSTEASVQVDPALAGTAVVLPPAETNAVWAQSGGNAAKSMGHLALGATPTMAWRTSIGEGSGKKAQLASSPVFGDGRVYTI